MKLDYAYVFLFLFILFSTTFNHVTLYVNAHAYTCFEVRAQSYTLCKYMFAKVNLLLQQTCLIWLYLHVSMKVETLNNTYTVIVSYRFMQIEPFKVLHPPGMNRQLCLRKYRQLLQLFPLTPMIMSRCTQHRWIKGSISLRNPSIWYLCNSLLHLKTYA